MLHWHLPSLGDGGQKARQEDKKQVWDVKGSKEVSISTVGLGNVYELEVANFPRVKVMKPDCHHLPLRSYHLGGLFLIWSTDGVNIDSDFPGESW